jgi:hypothetical protein
MRNPPLGMYRGAFFVVSGGGPAALAAFCYNDTAPTETHTLLSSYPQVFPSRHAAVPDERASTTPLDVSAAQCVVSPIFDEHGTVAA